MHAHLGCFQHGNDTLPLFPFCCSSRAILHLNHCCVCANVELWTCLQAPYWITRDQGDKLSKVLANTEQLKAILSALILMSNPFQSESSLTSEEAQLQASDFKSRLLKYYFSPLPPPGLRQLPSQAYGAVSKMTCMVSKLVLSSNLVEASQILPFSTGRTFVLTGLQTMRGILRLCLFAVGQLCSGYF